MHRHNLDQIAEFAQGALADETVAAALVESCDTCRAEYESQVAMMSLLSGTVGPTMTEHEKAALHRDLWTELRTSTPAVDRGPAWWRPWAFGAAALFFVVVGGAALLSNIGGADDSAGEVFNEIAADLGGDGSAAAETTTTAAEADVDAEEAPASPAYTRDLSQSEFEEIANSVRTDEQQSYSGATYDDSTNDATCLEEAGLLDHLIIRGFEEMTDLIVAVPSERTASQLVVSFVDPISCELVHVED